MLAQPASTRLSPGKTARTNGHNGETSMNTQPGIYGRKLGCTQIFEEDGRVTRVTVIEAGPVFVVGKRTLEKDGYTALILGLEERKAKHTTKPAAGAYKKANVTPKRILKELRCEAEFAAKY